MPITQECLDTLKGVYACKISKLGKKYYQALQIGSNCSQTLLFQLNLSSALLQAICNIDLEEETCLTEEQVCDILDKLKQILDKNKCNCCN